MDGQSYFLGIAGLAISLAGFAGLVSAFRHGSTGWTGIALWRLRAIVRLAFLCAFVALSPIPLYALLGDQALVLRVGSGILVLLYGWEIVATLRDRTEWPEAQDRIAAFVVDGLFALLQLGNIVWGSLGVFELGLLFRLMHPANIFLRVVMALRPDAGK